MVQKAGAGELRRRVYATGKEQIVENCKNGVYDYFGDLKIERVEGLDGYKFYFDESSWIMITPKNIKEPLI